MPANPYYLTVVFYLINTGMFIVVSMFFRFHVTLIIQNLTTIEHMDRKRGSEARNEVVNVPNFESFFYFIVVRYGCIL